MKRCSPIGHRPRPKLRFNFEGGPVHLSLRRLPSRGRRGEAGPPFVKDYKLFVRGENPLSQINFVWKSHYRRGTPSPWCLQVPFLSGVGFGNKLAVNSPDNSSRPGVNLHNARFIMAYNESVFGVSLSPLNVL